MPKGTKYISDLEAAIHDNKIAQVTELLELRARKRETRIFTCLPESKDRIAKELASAVYKASKLLDPTILRYLLDYGGNVNYTPEACCDGQIHSSALHIAVRRGLPDTVSILLDHNADVNKRDHRGRTPLHISVKVADSTITRTLLCRGADVNAVDYSGYNSLQLASRFGHVELVRLLLEHNASMFTKDQKGPSPLHIATFEGHVPLIDIFSHYVDVNILSVCDDQVERVPLHLCAMKGYIETVRFLVERHSADVNILDGNDQTPLHAVLNNVHDPQRMRRREDFDLVVDIFLKKGASVNRQDKAGNTALHLAAKNQFHKAAELLILHTDTDMHLRNKDGLVASDMIPDFDLAMKQMFTKYAMFASPYVARGCCSSPGCPCSPSTDRPARPHDRCLVQTFHSSLEFTEPTAPLD